MLDSKRQPKASDYMEFAKLASMPSFQEFLESHDQTGRLGNMTQRVLEKMNTHMYGATGQNAQGGVVGDLWDSNVMEATVIGGRISFKMKDGLQPGQNHEANLMNLIKNHSTNINYLANTSAALTDQSKGKILHDLARQFNMWGQDGVQEKPSFFGALTDQFSQVGRDMEANIRATGADPASQTPSAFTRKKVTKQPDGSFTIQEGEQRSPF
jgi:hypothetical protein